MDIEIDSQLPAVGDALLQASRHALEASASALIGAAKRAAAEYFDPYSPLDDRRQVGQTVSRRVAIFRSAHLAGSTRGGLLGLGRGTGTSTVYTTTWIEYQTVQVMSQADELRAFDRATSASRDFFGLARRSTPSRFQTTRRVLRQAVVEVAPQMPSFWQNIFGRWPDQRFTVISDNRF